MDGVEFVYALNLSRCIGCRRCVHACVDENNQPRIPEIQYIRVLKMEKGELDLETSDHHYDLPLVPENDSFFMPVQCHQCANPPCVKVCPVEPPGRTRTGSSSSITTGASAAAIARRRALTGPGASTSPNRNSLGRLNPNMSYLSNRPRHRGVMEKCTFCLHRTRAGRTARLPGGLPDRVPQVRQRARSGQRSLLHPRQSKRVFIR